MIPTTNDSVIRTEELGQRLKTIKLELGEFTVVEYYLYDQKGNEREVPFLNYLTLLQAYIQGEFEDDREKFDSQMNKQYDLTLSLLTREELTDLLKKVMRDNADYRLTYAKPAPLIPDVPKPKKDC